MGAGRRMRVRADAAEELRMNAKKDGAKKDKKLKYEKELAKLR